MVCKQREKHVGDLGPSRNEDSNYVSKERENQAAAGKERQ